MARRFTHASGQFANGEVAIEVMNDGISWTIFSNGRRTKITRGAMRSGPDALGECLNMVNEGTWIEIEAPEEGREALPASSTEDHW